MAPLWLLLLLLAAPARATWDSCDGTCGLQPMAEEFGGGSGPVPGAWPGLASIQDPLRAGSGHVCGGSLIAPGWLLTAARCLPRNVTACRVVLGAADLSDPGPEAQVRRVRRARLHPGLDVALLQLQPPARCSDFVQLGCVSRAGQQRGTEGIGPCYTAGWAPLAGTAPPREVMREAQVRLLPPELCDSAGSAAPAQVCAEHPRGGSDTCQGDPGAPLVCRFRGSGPFWLLGVTASGRGCVFTPAWLFSRWILRQLESPEPIDTFTSTGSSTGSSPGGNGSTESSGGSGPELEEPNAVLLRFFSVMRDLIRFLRDTAGG
ncbi:acrosin-like [Zonotrichia leucophrys gambelii]|uniref:acrosin-like n=1 Tax=Zonotrichia leucophrys gambelii TaxID=257770 RepID=UPI0031401DF4